MDSNLLKTLLPIGVIGIAMAFRLRSMNRVRPLKVERLWVLPALLIALAVGTLIMSPLGIAGLSICSAALIVGGLLGWQRGRMIRIDRDPASGALTQQTSPAAMILLVAIVALRFALRSYFDATPGADGRMSAQALIVTDALLLFAVGLLAMTRIEMGIRARRILAGGSSIEA